MQHVVFFSNEDKSAFFLEMYFKIVHTVRWFLSCPFAEVNYNNIILILLLLNIELKEKYQHRQILSSVTNNKIDRRDVSDNQVLVQTI